MSIFIMFGAGAGALAWLLARNDPPASSPPLASAGDDIPRVLALRGATVPFVWQAVLR